MVFYDKEGSIKISTDSWSITTVLDATFATLLMIAFLILLYQTVSFVLKSTNHRSEYQQKLLKILREYDRIIVIARDGYESNQARELVKVETFDELLEIKQTLQKPIIYSRVNSVKSEFIVEDNEKLYKFTFKEADI